MDTDPDALSTAWLGAQHRLPNGWQLDGLRCASTGMTAEERSDDWVAVAHGPDGAKRTFQAADPIDALDGLVAYVSSESSGPTSSPDPDDMTDEEFWAAAAERGRQQPTSEITMLVPSLRPKG